MIFDCCLAIASMKSGTKCIEEIVLHLIFSLFFSDIFCLYLARMQQIKNQKSVDLC